MSIYFITKALVIVKVFCERTANANVLKKIRKDKDADTISVSEK